MLIVETPTFKQWFHDLGDRQGRGRIIRRLDRLANGNPGDVKPVGQGVSEMRIDYGPGYRVYFLSAGQIKILLLCGGDKRTQTRDITLAKKLAVEWKGRLHDL